MNSSTTVTKIAGALLKAQKDMGDATKNSKNPFFKSTYADLNAIREVVTPALNSQGVAILQPTITLGDKNFVETILLHESGEFISGITEIKNIDGKPQSEGSGISYARRYGLQSMLNIGAVDDDGEAAQGRKSETVKFNTVSTTPRVEVVASPVKSGVQSETTRPVKELITETYKVLEAQGKISKEAFKMNYLGNKGLSTVTPSELPGIYDKLKKDFPTLNGSK